MIGRDRGRTRLREIIPPALLPRHGLAQDLPPHLEQPLLTPKSPMPDDQRNKDSRDDEHPQGGARPPLRLPPSGARESGYEHDYSEVGELPTPTLLLCELRRDLVDDTFIAGNDRGICRRRLRGRESCG